jgi:hypothetical protein
VRNWCARQLASRRAAIGQAYAGCMVRVAARGAIDQAVKRSRSGDRPRRRTRSPIAKSEAGWPANSKNWTHVQQSLAAQPVAHGASLTICRRIAQSEKCSDLIVSIALHDA